MRPSFAASTLLLLGSIACASSGGAPGTTTESVDIRFPRSSLSVDTQRETFISADTVAAAPSSVYQAVREIFAALNFRVHSADSAAMVVITQPTLVRHRLQGARLSKYLSCGQSAAGANADAYFLTVRLQSTVRPAGPTSALLHTNVSATARPADNGAALVRCASNGLLERHIRDLVRVNALSGRQDGGR
jgi:hypothetical protein